MVGRMAEITESRVSVGLGIPVADYPCGIDGLEKGLGHVDHVNPSA